VIDRCRPIRCQSAAGAPEHAARRGDAQAAPAGGRPVRNWIARRRLRRSRSAAGFLLLLVLLVVSGVSLAALAFSDSMLLGNEEVRLIGQRVQARAAVDSGVEAVRLILSLDRQSQADGGGVWDNPLQFQAINVLPSLDPNQRCNFSILAPNLDPSGQLSGLRYGLQNESARLNLNVLAVIEQQLPGTGRQLLMGLPNMTEDIADAILDWLDEDDDPREFGAEQDTYAQLPNPYRPTNGPMQSVEELLLVRGVTPQLLFGLDQNRNGLLDPQESAQAMGMLDTSDGGASLLGWAHYLTLHSQETNTRPDGQPRVNINQPDLQQLESELNEVLGNPDWVSFILAYRLYGAGGAAGGGAVTPPGGGGARLPAAYSPALAGRSGPTARLVAFQPPPGGRPGGAGGGQPGGGRPGAGGGQPGGGRPGGGRPGGPGGGGPGGGGPGGGGPGRGGMGGGRLQAAPGRPPGGQAGGGGPGGNTAQTRPWSSGAAPLDLSQAGSGRFGQVLDLIGGSFTAPDSAGQPATFTSPFDESPLAMAAYLPQLMQNLTTLSAPPHPWSYQHQRGAGTDLGGSAGDG
jgi:hypothetical protein